MLAIARTRLCSQSQSQSQTHKTIYMKRLQVAGPKNNDQSPCVSSLLSAKCGGSNTSRHITFAKSYSTTKEIKTISFCNLKIEFFFIRIRFQNYIFIKINFNINVCFITLHSTCSCKSRMFENQFPLHSWRHRKCDLACPPNFIVICHFCNLYELLNYL